MVMNNFIAVGTVLALLSSERDQRLAASPGISGAAGSGGEHPETFSGTEVYHHEHGRYGMGTDLIGPGSGNDDSRPRLLLRRTGAEEERPVHLNTTTAFIA